MSALSIVIIVIVVIVMLLLKSKNKGNTVDSSQSNQIYDSLGERIDTTSFETSGEFSMKIDDVFTITGRGTVVTGRIEKGMVRVNDVVKIDGLSLTWLS